MEKQQETEQMTITEEQYLYEMNDIQRKAYHIARDHLGTSFNVAKSNGFKEWKKQKQQNEQKK
jgi:hypothetical protein